MQIKKLLKTNEFFLFMVIVLFCVVFGFINPAFFSLGNWFDILKSMIETGILAMGVLVVLISGGFDMSFMAVAVFAMHLICLYFGKYVNDAPLWFLLLCGMAVGMILGVCNSFFVAKCKLPPFIVTLGTSNIISGLCLAFIGSKQVNNIPAALISFSRWNVISVENAAGGRANLHGGIIILAVAAVLTTILLSKTMLGRSIYCLGGNPFSCIRVGFQNNKIIVFVYAFMGTLAGLSGLLHASFQRMSNPYDMVGNELNVIAAVVIGGTGVGGGKGKMDRCPLLLFQCGDRRGDRSAGRTV